MKTATAPLAAARCGSITRIRPRGARGLGAWVALPEGPPAGLPLVAVHGIQRRADLQARLHASRAASRGRVVVAPHFAGDAWQSYQRIGRKTRPDLALIDLMRELVFRGLLAPGSDTRFELTGFSGGAQFAHRFAMLHPDRVARLIVTAAGWYTFPDDAPYPYGLDENRAGSEALGPRMATNLEAFLSIPTDICVGAMDDQRDGNVRAGPKIDAQQGRTRIERANRWRDALAEAAAARGISRNARLHFLPECGHDFEDCVRTGGLLDIVFGESVPDLPVAGSGHERYRETLGHEQGGFNAT